MRPPSFWFKLLGFVALASILAAGAVLTPLTAVLHGNYSPANVLPVLLGFSTALTTAITYSLDPNHKAATGSDILSAIGALATAVEANKTLPASATEIAQAVVSAQPKVEMIPGELRTFTPAPVEIHPDSIAAIAQAVVAAQPIPTKL